MGSASPIDSVSQYWPMIAVVFGFVLVWILFKVTCGESTPREDPKVREEKIQKVQDQLASLKKKRSQNMKKSIEQNVSEDPAAAARALRNMMKK